MTCEGECPATHVKCEGTGHTVCLEKKFWGTETAEDMCMNYVFDLIADGVQLGLAIASYDVVTIVGEATGGQTRTLFEECDHWFDEQSDV